MPIYHKPVKELFKEMVNEFGSRKDEIITRNQCLSWFNTNYPKIKNSTITAHLLKMSINAPSRIHYGVNPKKDLQNYLSKNLNKIETGLVLYEDEGINGIEFPAGNRFIDILALDKNNDYVIIELKVSRGYDRVAGQISRYIAWIKKYQANEGQSVRGIIIAKEISEDLKLACSEISHVDLYEYELSVSVKKIDCE